MFVDGNVCCHHTEKYKAKFQVFWAVFHHSFFLYRLTQLGRKKMLFELFQFFWKYLFSVPQGTWTTSAAITNKTICQISKQCSIVNSDGKRFLNYYVKFLTCVRIHKLCRLMNLFNDSVFAPALPKFPETTRLQSEPHYARTQITLKQDPDNFRFSSYYSSHVVVWTDKKFLGKVKCKNKRNLETKSNNKWKRSIESKSGRCRPSFTDLSEIYI